jgi:peroxiredoxin
LSNSLKKFLVVALLFVMAVVLLAGCGSSSSQGGSTTTTQGPKMAPDFTVSTLVGSTINFSSNLKGKPVVINFAASWCGPCEQEAPVLVQLYAKYKDKVQFFGLAVRDSLEDQTAFAQRHGLEFPIGLDKDGDVLYEYQKAARVTLSGIPTTFFIGADGSIKDFYIGPISEKIFEQKVQALLTP